MKQTGRPCNAVAGQRARELCNILAANEGLVDGLLMVAAPPPPPPQAMNINIPQGVQTSQTERAGRTPNSGS